jgi:hypothetical protein
MLPIKKYAIKNVAVEPVNRHVSVFTMLRVLVSLTLSPLIV